MPLTPSQAVEAAIQLLLDDAGDGWTLSGFVIVMGLERVAGDDIESASWMHTPANQPGWVTQGLLDETDRLYAEAGEE